MVAADRQAAEAVEDDMAVTPKYETHPHMSQLVDQDRKEYARDPDQQILKANIQRVPAHDGADQPKHRMHADRDAEHAPVQIVWRLVGFQQEHAGSPCAASARG